MLFFLICLNKKNIEEKQNKTKNKVLNFEFSLANIPPRQRAISFHSVGQHSPNTPFPCQAKEPADAHHMQDLMELLREAWRCPVSWVKCSSHCGSSGVENEFASWHKAWTEVGYLVYIQQGGAINTQGEDKYVTGYVRKRRMVPTFK